MGVLHKIHWLITLISWLSALHIFKLSYGNQAILFTIDDLCAVVVWRGYFFRMFKTLISSFEFCEVFYGVLLLFTIEQFIGCFLFVSMHLTLNQIYLPLFAVPEGFGCLVG